MRKALSLFACLSGIVLASHFAYIFFKSLLGIPVLVYEPNFYIALGEFCLMLFIIALFLVLLEAEIRSK